MLFCFAHFPLDQCCGSMTFWRGSGSADPCLWLMDPDSDPDPDIFVIDPQDAKKNNLKKSFSAYNFLKGHCHLHHFSKIQSQTKSQNSRNQGFSYYFCLTIEGSGSGSISLADGSGSGSRRPKNIRIRRIRIRNTSLSRLLFNLQASSQ